MKRSTILAGAGVLALALTPAVTAFAGNPVHDFLMSVPTENCTADSFTLETTTTPFEQEMSMNGSNLMLKSSADLRDGEHYNIGLRVKDGAYHDDGCRIGASANGFWFNGTEIPVSALGWGGSNTSTGGATLHLAAEVYRIKDLVPDPEPEPVQPKVRTNPVPMCDEFEFTPELLAGEVSEATYEIVAQYYDSETIEMVDEIVFEGTAPWGETVKIDLEPAADDYLLWVYRVNGVASPKSSANIGEIQLDCRPEEPEDPEDPEEPSDEVPLTPLEPATPIEDDAETPEVPETPETPDVPEVEEPETPEVPADEPSTEPVVTDEATTSGDPVVEAATPVKATPKTVG